MTENRHIEMLFALLRLGLGTGSLETKANTKALEECSPADWQDCYKEALNQGVAAIAWDGIAKLPKELQPPISTKIPWGVYTEQCEAKYRRYCRAVGELSALFAERGIAMVQIKGVGFASYYPKPSHREGGDIDIYTYSSNTAKMSHAQANALADSMMTDGMCRDEISYKHSKFYYKGIPVENHKCFLNVRNYRSAKHLEPLLLKLLNPVETTLPDGERSIQTPSLRFCTIHTAYHAMSHYYEGLRLHHLCDWAIILKQTGGQMPSEVTDSRFLAWADNLTQLCDHYLATRVGGCGVSNQAQEIMDSMVDSQLRTRVPYKDPIRILIYKTLRMFYRAWVRKKYLGRNRLPFFSIKYHIKNPHKIFART